LRGRLGHAALLADGKKDFQLAQLESLPNLVDRTDRAPPEKVIAIFQ
jgi:hypothetical protein